MYITKSWTIPLRIEPAANKWEHWSKKKARHTKYRKALLKIKPQIIEIAIPCKIMLTRIAPRQLDYDNLLYSLKSIRDDLTQWIFPTKPRGQGDSNCGLDFLYNQEKGLSNQYALRIDIIQ